MKVRKKILCDFTFGMHENVINIALFYDKAFVYNCNETACIANDFHLVGNHHDSQVHFFLDFTNQVEN